MRIKKSLIAVLLPLCLMTASCSDDQLRRAAQASADLSHGISLALDLDAALIKEGVLNNQDAVTITTALLDINRLNKQFIDKAKTYKSIDAPARAELTKFAADISDALSKLNAQGTLRIKNPQSQAQFQAVMGIMTVAAGVLTSILGKGGN